MYYRGICSNEKNDPVKEKLNEFFRPLASAYIKICKKQKEKQKPFFGLRDFYRYYYKKVHDIKYLVNLVSSKCCIGCVKRVKGH